MIEKTLTVHCSKKFMQANRTLKSCKRMTQRNERKTEVKQNIFYVDLLLDRRKKNCIICL